VGFPWSITTGSPVPWSRKW